MVIAAALVAAAVATLNVLVDPYGVIGLGLMPTATTTDRTVKADLVQALKRPPQLIVLGSSRSMLYEPAYLKAKTGQDTFNGGLNGVGGVADSWAMMRFIHDRYPSSRPRYLWLVDVESFVPVSIEGRTSAEPRLARYIDGSSAVTNWHTVLTRAIQERATEASLATAKDFGAAAHPAQASHAGRDRLQKTLSS